MDEATDRLQSMFSSMLDLKAPGEDGLVMARQNIDICCQVIDSTRGQN